MFVLCPECNHHYNDDHESKKCEGLADGGAHFKIRDSAVEEANKITRQFRRLAQ